jgi:hypothetical protein
MSDDLSALRLIKHIITNFHPTYLCIYYSVEYSLEALAYFPLSIVITHYVAVYRIGLCDVVMMTEF